MKHLGLAFLCLFAVACSNAYALQPENLGNADQYTRVGGTAGWARQWQVPSASGTAGLVLETPGDNSYTAGDPHLFLFGTSIRLSCTSTSAVFWWAKDTGTTMLKNGLMTDGASTGAGPSFRVESGTYVEEIALRSAYPDGSTGDRTGFCTGTTAARYLGAPCDADADCPGGACRGESNGSCTESTVNYCRDGVGPKNMQRGMFLQSRSNATAADCYIGEIR